jgi:hypothetical protein
MRISFFVAEEDMFVDGRIWPPYQAFYIQGMLFNCQSAIRSITRLDTIFERLPKEISHSDTESLPVHLILNELQNIIVQGAALSKYFWPIRKAHEDRGRHLREALQIEEGNPLRARAVRDAIEHFDERLDRYLESGIAGYIFPEFVGARPDEDDAPGHFFRAFFIDCGVSRLLSEEYEVNPLVAEILRIFDILQAADNGGGRFPVPDEVD